MQLYKFPAAVHMPAANQGPVGVCWEAVWQFCCLVFVVAGVTCYVCPGPLW